MEKISKKICNHNTYYNEFSISKIPEDNLSRATVKSGEKKWHLKNSSIQNKFQSIHDIISFGNISFTNPEINWFNKHLKSYANTSALERHLYQGMAVVVSDGSF